MALTLILLALALRAGLALRSSRRGTRKLSGNARRDHRARHLRLAKPAVALLLLGLALGVGSVATLRDWEPLGTFHAGLGLLVALLFGATATLGRRMETGRGRHHDVHALLGLLAMLVAAITAVAGLVLLP